MQCDTIQYHTIQYNTILHHHSDWGRIQFRVWTHKRHPLPRLWGVFCDIFEDNWLRYNGIALYVVQVYHTVNYLQVVPLVRNYYIIIFRHFWSSLWVKYYPGFWTKRSFYPGCNTYATLVVVFRLTHFREYKRWAPSSVQSYCKSSTFHKLFLVS